MNKVQRAIYRVKVNEGVYDPSIFKAIFLAGGPGSGKSFVAGNATSGMGFRVINSDDILEPKLKAAGLGTDFTTMTPDEIIRKDFIRKEAKKLKDMKLAMYMKGRLGLVIDGTGKDMAKMKEQKRDMESIGYDTFMIFVNTTLEVAQERNITRGRKVKPADVALMWNDVQRNLGGYQTMFSPNFVVVDNSDNVTDKEIFTRVWKQVAKFAKKPPRNIIARMWIADELMKKKR